MCVVMNHADGLTYKQAPHWPLHKMSCHGNIGVGDTGHNRHCGSLDKKHMHKLNLYEAIYSRHVTGLKGKYVKSLVCGFVSKETQLI